MKDRYGRSRGCPKSSTGRRPLPRRRRRPTTTERRHRRNEDLMNHFDLINMKRKRRKKETAIGQGSHRPTTTPPPPPPPLPIVSDRTMERNFDEFDRLLKRRHHTLWTPINAPSSGVAHLTLDIHRTAKNKILNCIIHSLRVR